jgi:hypothetical protein
VTENGIFGIPESVAKQSKLLAILNEYVSARVSVAIVLVLVLLVGAIGPKTLQAW